MKITAESDFRVLVDLTAGDMKQLDITYDQLDYANVETRRVLWTLLDEVRKQTGTALNLAEKLIIQTLPLAGNGCRIIFTAVPGKGEGMSVFEKEGRLAAEFDSGNAFLDFYAFLLRQECREPASLYEKDGRFRVLFGAAGQNPDRMRGIAEEFAGRILTSRESQNTEEYWLCRKKELFRLTEEVQNSPDCQTMQASLSC